jgi:MFS family permease
MERMVSVGDRSISCLKMAHVPVENAGAELRYRIGFRLFLAGQFFELLANHFFQIALPILALAITGNPFAVGSIIVTSGAARIVLIPFGGSLSDRFSPIAVILAASAARAGLFAMLSGFLLTGRLDWQSLYVFSFAFGVTEAFIIPARAAILPHLLPREHLPAANAILAGMEKGWGFIGPTFAGMTIAGLGAVSGWLGVVSGNLPGMAAALGIIIVALIGVMVCVTKTRRFVMGYRNAQGKARPEIEVSLVGTIRLVWRRPDLRVPFLMITTVNLLTIGPTFVGLPVLAAARFAGNAGALGFLMSAVGGGALLGALAAGVLPAPVWCNPGRQIALLSGGIGAGLAVAGAVSSLGVTVTAILAVSALASYVNVTGVTCLQQAAPQSVVGKIMGMVSLK